MDRVPNDLLGYFFELADKSTYRTSRLVSKRFQSVLSKYKKSKKKGSSIVYQSALDGNLNLLRLNIKYYGYNDKVATAAGISGNNDVIYYFFNNRGNNYYEDLFEGAILGCNKDLVFSCLCRSSRFFNLDWSKDYSDFNEKCVTQMTDTEVSTLINRVDFLKCRDFVATILEKFGFHFTSIVLPSSSDYDNFMCKACCKLNSYDLLRDAMNNGYRFDMTCLNYVDDVEFGRLLLRDGLITDDRFFDLLIKKADIEILRYKHVIIECPWRIHGIIQNFDLDIIREMAPLAMKSKNAYRISPLMELLTMKGKEYLKVMIEHGMNYRNFKFDTPVLEKFKLFDECDNWHLGNMTCEHCKDITISTDDERLDLPFMSPYDLSFLEKCHNLNIKSDYSLYFTMKNPSFELCKFIVDHNMISDQNVNILFYMEGAKYYVEKNPDFLSISYCENDYIKILRHYTNLYNKKSAHILDFLLNYVPSVYLLVFIAAKIKAKKGFRVDLIRRYLEINRVSQLNSQLLSRLKGNYAFLLDEQKNRTVLTIRCGDKIAKKSIKRKIEAQPEESNKKPRKA